jgi:hypothetical protein
MTLGKPKSSKAVPFKLNERHARFCRSIIAGMSQRAAYVTAGFSAKFKGGPTQLMKRPEIRERLKVLREAQRIRLKVTLDSLVLDLRQGQDLAVASGNAAAYVQATMGLAKLMGFLKEDRPGDEINIFINRPLREPSKELELTPDQWVAKWAPKLVDKANGHGNGHDGNGKDQG